MQVNEKLKALKIIDPRVVFDKSFFDDFNFKLSSFEYQNNSRPDVVKIDFLRRVVMPIVQSQLKSLQSIHLSTITLVDLTHLIEHENFKSPTVLKIFINDKIVRFETEIMKCTCNGFTSTSHFDEDILSFLKTKCVNNLKHVTLSGVNLESLKFCFNELGSLQTLALGAANEDISEITSERVKKVETTCTTPSKISSLLKTSPKAQSFRVFQLNEEVMNVLEKNLPNLKQIEYHFADLECLEKSKFKLIHFTSLDPLMIIPEELHDLIFQHIDEFLVEDLTRTWSKFYFTF